MEDYLKKIDKKLTVITSLLLEKQFNSDNRSHEKELIKYLKDMNFEIQEIAEILNKDSKHVSYQVYNLKRNKERKLSAKKKVNK